MAKKKQSAKIPGLFDRLLEAAEVANANQLATLVGMSATSIYQWKRGENLPSIAELLEISRSKGVSLHWLLTGEGPKDLEVILAIKEGELDIDAIKREILIQYHLDEMRNLLGRRNVDEIPRGRKAAS